MLYREPKLLKESPTHSSGATVVVVSVLYREPKLLKARLFLPSPLRRRVSVLYREPKLLKVELIKQYPALRESFSALP